MISSLFLRSKDSIFTVRAVDVNYLNNIAASGAEKATTGSLRYYQKTGCVERFHPIYKTAPNFTYFSRKKENPLQAFKDLIIRRIR